MLHTGIRLLCANKNFLLTYLGQRDLLCWSKSPPKHPRVGVTKPDERHNVVSSPVTVLVSKISRKGPRRHRAVRARSVLGWMA